MSFTVLSLYILWYRKMEKPRKTLIFQLYSGIKQNRASFVFKLIIQFCTFQITCSIKKLLFKSFTIVYLRVHNLLTSRYSNNHKEVTLLI